MTESLSSTILERQFGPTDIQVLRQDDAARIICTKVVKTGKVLELSYVRFAGAGQTEFPEVHQQIIAGQSMGKAFAARQILFERQIHGTYKSSRLPRNVTERFKASEPATIMTVSILVGPNDTPYADILEIYSPEVLWRSELEEAGAAILDRMQAFSSLLPPSGI